MTTTFYLIRHGETEWNRSGRWQGHADVALTDAGRDQARSLAQHLRDEGIHFDHIYASDLSRAYNTAEMIAEALGTTAQREPRLREIDVGSWSGLTRAEIIARHPDAFKVAFHPDDGETWEAFVDRSSAILTQLADLHPDHTIAIVTHGGVIRAMISFIYEQQGQPDQRIGTISNTSVTEVQCADGVWTIERFNDISHLNPQLQAPDMLARPNEGSEAK